MAQGTFRVWLELTHVAYIVQYNSTVVVTAGKLQDAFSEKEAVSGLGS